MFQLNFPDLVSEMDITFNIVSLKASKNDYLEDNMPYKTIEEANPAIKGIKPPVTLGQANSIASAADAITGVDSPWAVAISSFKKGHVVEDGKWVKKAEEGKKDDTAEFAYEKGFTYAADNAHCTECGPVKGKVNPDDEKCPGCGQPFSSKKEITSSIKAITTNGKRYLWMETMNAFRDREGEIFSTKAIQEYVDFADRVGRKDRARFWHVPGTEFGTVVWQDVVGRVLLELVEVDDTSFGNKMFHALQHPEEFPGVLPEGWGTSHGYLYRRKDLDGDGTYNRFVKFESTVLPAHRASNSYGEVMTKEKKEIMADKAKEKALAQLVGDEEAQKALEATKGKSKGLETEADFKEVGDDGEGVWEFEVTDEFLDEVAGRVDVSAGLKELSTSFAEQLVAFKEELMKEVLDAVAKTVTALAGTKEQIVKEAIQGRIQLKPFTASKANGNVATGDDAVKAAKKAKGRKKKEPSLMDEIVDTLVLPGQ